MARWSYVCVLAVRRRPLGFVSLPGPSRRGEVWLVMSSAPGTPSSGRKPVLAECAPSRQPVELALLWDIRPAQGRFA